MSLLQGLPRRRLLHCLLAASLAGFCLPAIPAASRPVVVATFSILGDLAARIGGDRIELHVLVGPDSDGHMYQPTPADSRLLGTAALVITNGMGFEGWMQRLVTASGYAGNVVTASNGIEPLFTGEGREREPDPHAWQSLANIRLYIANIVTGLAAVAPADAGYFSANAAILLNDIDLLEHELLTAMATLPPERRTVVTSHDAFAYFGVAYGLSFVAPVGINTDSEASAKDVAALIRQIHAEHIAAVFVENITDPRLLERIAAETGASRGGTLFSDALSAADGPAGTYLDMMRHNIHTLVRALGAASPTRSFP